VIIIIVVGAAAIVVAGERYGVFDSGRETESTSRRVAGLEYWHYEKYRL
jgi:hypothetical protein